MTIEKMFAETHIFLKKCLQKVISHPPPPLQKNNGPSLTNDDSRLRYSKFVVLRSAFCIFCVFLFRQSSQRTAQETNMYMHKFKRSRFVIRDQWISIRFVCFMFQGLLLCDRPVSGNNRLVRFALQIFMIFLILVTCKNKATTSASFLRQKIHSSSRFPSLFLSSLESFSAKVGRASMLHCKFH